MTEIIVNTILIGFLLLLSLLAVHIFVEIYNIPKREKLLKFLSKLEDSISHIIVKIAPFFMSIIFAGFIYIAFFYGYDKNAPLDLCFKVLVSFLLFKFTLRTFVSGYEVKYLQRMEYKIERIEQKICYFLCALLPFILLAVVIFLCFIFFIP